MALTQVGNRVYAKITDLSEEAALASGDKIIFHSTTTGNACIVDWSNVKIDLDHCTFGPTFSEVVNFTSTAQAWVDTMTASFEEIESRVDDAINTVVKLNDEVAGIKLLLKMMLGLVNMQDPDLIAKYKNTLTEQAIQTYEEIINEVEDAQNCKDKLDFTLANYLQFIGIK